MVILGAYLGVIEEKPDISFWGTLASGIAGAGVGLGANLLSDHNKITGVLAALLPLVFSIIYADLFD